MRIRAHHVVALVVAAIAVVVGVEVVRATADLWDAVAGGEHAAVAAKADAEVPAEVDDDAAYRTLDPLEAPLATPEAKPSGRKGLTREERAEKRRNARKKWRDDATDDQIDDMESRIAARKERRANRPRSLAAELDGGAVNGIRSAVGSYELERDVEGAVDTDAP